MVRAITKQGVHQWCQLLNGANSEGLRRCHILTVGFEAVRRRTLRDHSPANALESLGIRRAPLTKPPLFVPGGQGSFGLGQGKTTLEGSWYPPAPLAPESAKALRTEALVSACALGQAALPVPAAAPSNREGKHTQTCACVCDLLASSVSLPGSSFLTVAGSVITCGRKCGSGCTQSQATFDLARGEHHDSQAACT